MALKASHWQMLQRGTVGKLALASRADRRHRAWRVLGIGRGRGGAPRNGRGEVGARKHTRPHGRHLANTRAGNARKIKPTDAPGARAHVAQYARKTLGTLATPHAHPCPKRWMAQGCQNPL